MTEQRKRVISRLSEYIASEFSLGNITSLQEIIKFEELYLHYDNYENAFDGMLVSVEDDFHIHINTNLGNTEESKRGRFTLAHELGHFFIDEHRINLKSGKTEPHGSFHGKERKEPIEIEADYFASCLLLPEKKLRSCSGAKKFSLETINSLSNAFQASIPATIIRFSEVGTHNIMAIFSRDNVPLWYVKSNDFPSWPFKFRIGQKLPPTSVSGEFFTKQDSKYTGVEKVSADDWFYPKDKRGDKQMYEQCYYSNSYGYVISILWFD
ncbi:MAG TPA: ImmA/IrrE family metallo-endopeptidase [Bacteroidia bacterium]|jgi:Zn-dependent peptidase ImmA (M78 family)|nr:ImmA/IrrE family metallo-endopeptidase [Bacteroidia bacterium]